MIVHRTFDLNLIVDTTGIQVGRVYSYYRWGPKLVKRQVPKRVRSQLCRRLNATPLPLEPTQ